MRQITKKGKLITSNETGNGTGYCTGSSTQYIYMSGTRNASEKGAIRLLFILMHGWQGGGLLHLDVGYLKRFFRC
jgi:hypothetical protein